MAPSSLAESPVATVWPTIGATLLGRWVGRLSALRLGYGFFTLGKLMALATIPVSLAVFCWQLMPWVCRRYALTSRRIIIQKGLAAAEGRSLGLDGFDAIEILILPGQAWLHAGEVIFRHQGQEVFRLAGVSRPEVFRQVCLKVQNSLRSFQEIHREAAAPPAG
jgi:hypothetical protein